MKKTILIIMLGFMGIALFAQTTYESPYKDLPKDTQKYISKNFEGWSIDKCVVTENTKGKMSSCDVFVSKGTEKYKVIFDKDGEYVKKEAIAAAPAATPAAAPVAAPAAAPVAAPAAVPDTTKKPK